MYASLRTRATKLSVALPAGRTGSSRLLSAPAGCPASAASVALRFRFGSFRSGPRPVVRGNAEHRSQRGLRVARPLQAERAAGTACAGRGAGTRWGGEATSAGSWAAGVAGPSSGGRASSRRNRPGAVQGSAFHPAVRCSEIVPR